MNARVVTQDSLLHVETSGHEESPKDPATSEMRLISSPPNPMGQTFQGYRDDLTMTGLVLPHRNAVTTLPLTLVASVIWAAPRAGSVVVTIIIPQLLNEQAIMTDVNKVQVLTAGGASRIPPATTTSASSWQKPAVHEAQNKGGDEKLMTLEYEEQSEEATTQYSAEIQKPGSDNRRVTYADDPTKAALASADRHMSGAAEADGGSTSDLLWLLICFLGIMASFVAYGLLLENATSGGNKLHELSFLLVTSSLYTITAAAGRYVRDETPTTIPPARFAVLGLTSMGSTFFSVRALR